MIHLERIHSMGWPKQILLLALTVGMASCLTQPVTRPVDFHWIENTQELLDGIKKEGLRVSSVRASGSIDTRRGNKRFKAHVLYIIRRPATLRFETESFFDQPLSILVTDGMEFSLWDMQKGRFLSGPATPANISQAIPIPMDGPEVVGILLGDPPVIPYASVEHFIEKDLDQYRIIFKNSRQMQEILIHPETLRPKKVTCRSGDVLEYQLTYEGWIQNSDGSVIPQKMFFELPSEQVRLTLKLSESEHNLPLDNNLFILSPPEGVSIETLTPNSGND